jgi:hypothetical protein
VSLLRCFEDRRALPHAEIVVRAPDGDFGTDAVIEGPRKAAATPLEIGKEAIASFAPQLTELPLAKRPPSP